MSSIRRFALCILFALLIAQTLPGQQQAPHLAPVGTSHPTQVNAPFLQMDSAPLLGERLRLDLMGGEPQQSGFLGLGDGTFGTRTFMPLSDWITQARLADMNRDGLADLASLTRFKLQVHLASPTGGFLAPTEVTPVDMDTNYGLPIGDFDGNGYPDVLTHNGWPTFGELWRNDGTGNLLPSIHMPHPNQCPARAVQSYRQDGTLEILITAGYEFMVIRDMTPQGPMTAERRPSLQIDTQPFFVDVDLDGLVDLVAMNTAIGEATLAFCNQRGGRK